jgi:tripartite-type tricarboxylate transporter receptor subunit TctC
MRRREHRTTVGAVVALAALLLSAASSDAQPWPQRSVRLIVPFAAGSSPDIAGRVFAQHLAMRWGKAVVVENRPGAEGLTGTTAFAAMPDDHNLLLTGATPISVYPFTQEKLAYDPVRDVLPVSMVVESFGTVSVPTSLPVKSLSDFASFARSRPRQLNWATGSAVFTILMAGFAKAAGLEMTHVPYRDQNLALQDLAEGRTQIFATGMAAILPLVQAGRIRALAVTNKTRPSVWPGVPTVSESGFPDIAFEGILGVFASRGTSAERRDQIAAQIRAIAADPAVTRQLSSSGQIVRASTPAEFSAAIEEQRSRIAAIVQLIGKAPQ